MSLSVHLVVRTLFAAGLLNGMFARSSEVAEPALGILFIEAGSVFGGIGSRLLIVRDGNRTARRTICGRNGSRNVVLLAHDDLA